MKIHRAYQYRLYPTKEQEKIISQTIGCCRFVYNKGLEWRMNAYKDEKKTLSAFDTMKMLTKLKNEEEFSWLKKADSQALQQSLRHLDAAYKRFFKKLGGFPKFKSRNNARKSYTTTKCAIVSSSAVKLPKVGIVKANLHFIPSKEYSIKSVCVFQDVDGKFFITIPFEYEVPEGSAEIRHSKVIGLDYKSDGLYVDSNGKCAEMPHYFKLAQKRLKRQQRKLSRKQRGSNNYLKQKHRVAVIYKHVRNQRKDFLNKESKRLAENYDLVSVEDLNMKEIGAKKGFKLGKETGDNGFGMFLQMLDYKLEARGKKLVKVDKYFASSQICHSCGYKNPVTKDLKVRHLTCPKCGAVYDRDINAAINIRDEGWRLYSLAS